MWSKQIKEGLLITVCFILLCIPSIDLFHSISTDVSYSKVVYDSQGDLLQAFLSDDDKWRMRTEASDINEDLLQTLITKEDRFFYWHPGVNPIAVCRAAIKNLWRKDRISGASTITMQLARLLHPGPRNIASKLKEMLMALRLEWHYNKEEIFNAYINLLPYGGNIEGIQAASLLYYGKYPEQLSLGEITTLAVIPNDPERYRIDRDREALLQKRNTLLRYLQKRHKFPEAMITSAMKTEITGQRRSLPVKAPHYTRRMVAKYPQLDNIHGSLNGEIQTETERIAAAFSRQLAFKGIHNVSVFILDNESREVLAYVASQDFYDDKQAGQVDGIVALRAPGSTLKPLIYGIGFDEGLFTPKSTITDLPINYHGYSPENYDERYRGKVSIEDALAASLNIPAVKVLDAIGPDNLIRQLSLADFEWIRANKRRLGLSLALGGCGVSLEDLTNLYASFGQEGIYRPVRYSASSFDDQNDSLQLISASSAFMLYTILSRLDRPDLPHEAANAQNLPKVAWKTGTSYGRRDAWSIGYNSRYTVGVWAGNFSGEGRPELSGAEIATPLMLQVFRAIDRNKTDDGAIHKPGSLRIRYVCTESGLSPNTFCDQQALDYAIPNVTSSKTCDHLQPVWTNTQQSISYCGHCLPNDDVLETYYPNLPPDLISYYEKEHITYQKIPPHYELCDHIFSSGLLDIIQPEDGAEYFLDSVAQERIALKANTTADVQEIYWYINDVFFTATSPEITQFYTPKSGRQTISCRDDKGRNSQVAFQVTYY